MVMVLETLGLPADSVSIILSVDWLLDRSLLRETQSIAIEVALPRKSVKSLYSKYCTQQRENYRAKIIKYFASTLFGKSIKCIISFWKIIVRLLRFRTTVNVLGDSIGAAVVAHYSKRELQLLDSQGSSQLGCQNSNCSRRSPRAQGFSLC